MKPMLCPLLGWEEGESSYSYDCTGCKHYDQGVCRMMEKDFLEKSDW